MFTFLECWIREFYTRGRKKGDLCGKREGSPFRVEVGRYRVVAKSWALRQAMVVAFAATMFNTSLDAMANLNQFEANTRGGFNIGSTIQFGSIYFRFVYNDVWLQNLYFQSCHFLYIHVYTLHVGCFNVLCNGL